MKFSQQEVQAAAELLNQHSKHVEEHWNNTKLDIMLATKLSMEAVEELINTEEVRQAWTV